MAKRILTLTDEELDVILRWFEDLDAADDEDVAILEKLREARLSA